ncbi:F0F1 ATP synthase subunit delta [Candidatus Woesebacteria bacterium]|nr:F0F1 ATP synthase subunit delta [Candidatus Woesebacteria bacterium]
MKSLHQVHITTAQQLSEAALKKVRASLEKKYSKESLELVCTVSPELLGGIKITIDAIEYDGSVSGKLAQLKNHLLAEQMHNQ